MCEFNDDDTSHDPNPFSTVPPPSGPSGPSGPSEPQDSITANPLPKQSWEAGPAPKHGNPQKRKGATVTGEPEELENSPLTKRVQPEQHSIPSPVETPLGKEARSRSSSPLQRLSGDLDLNMPGPSAPAERPSTPPRYSTPSLGETDWSFPTWSIRHTLQLHGRALKSSMCRRVSCTDKTSKAFRTKAFLVLHVSQKISRSL
ncbi:hypothetical protein FMUND_3187 [Fusarium mundagurra]|uniref:Uncharacterized protein n=1 Tax=Fusarium mundagurra TaxID=1567541 RepID=A0A8H5Z3D3_9HYPO|nr:hypothetical protein FMUND_3187 [Fusarium mundagurra]